MINTTKNTTIINKTTETKKVAPGPVKTETTKTIKTEDSKNTEAAKISDSKSTVKKIEPKKTTQKTVKTTKKKDLEKTEKNAYIEFDGKQIDMNEMYARAEKIYKEIKTEDKIEDLKLYINVSENMVYFVVNGIAEDDFKFEI